MVVINSSKLSKELYCEKCNYKCSRIGDFKKHINTKKHNGSKMIQIDSIKKWVCNCGKAYKYDSGYYRHKKNCTFKELNNHMGQKELIEKENDFIVTKEMFMKLLDKNNELVKTIQEMAKQPNTMNSHNKFNLNFFLNEQCKNAMNLKDFVDSLTVQLEDLEYTKENGFTKGIANVFVNGLKQLDTFTRPIHCTDAKRTTMYVKDKNEWEKDDEHNSMKSTIGAISKKHVGAIKAWEAAHPGWDKNDKLNEEWIKMVQNITNRDNQTENIIIKHVANEVVVDK